MTRVYTDQTIVFAAAAANASSASINVVAFRHIEFEVSQVGFTGTIKFVGSNADAYPDFSSAASGTNPWSYIQTIDQIDGSTIAGGTGIASTTVTAVRNLEANVNGFKWVGVILSGVSAGSVTIKEKGYNDND